MICPACGANNRKDARFCRNCGRPMDEPEKDVEAGGPGGPTLNAEGEPVEEAPGEEPAPEEMQAEEPEAGDGSAAPEEVQAAGTEPIAAHEPGAGDAEPPVEIEAHDEAGAMPEIEPEVDLAPAAVDEAVPEGVADVEAQAAAGLAIEAEVDDRGAGTVVEPALELEPEAEIEDDILGAFWRDEGEPIEPAPPGTLIGDRYLVLEVLDATEDEVLYLARDLQGCWQCGAEIEVGESFCPQCGAAQEEPTQRAPEARLVEVRDEQDVMRPESSILARITHEGRPFLVLAELEAEPAPAAAPPTAESIRLIIGQRSDSGQVRELDEDSVLAIHVAPTYEGVTSPVIGLFAVADGMGGHDGGEIASKLALQVVADHALRTIILPELTGELLLDEDSLARLRRAVIAANDAVFLARQKRGNDMGTTLTTVLVRDRRMFVAHVGDCRAYRWSSAGLEQLTTDHSVVASMIAHGQVLPDEIYTHPHRSVIYRCVGDQPTVEVDGDLLPVEPGDRIVVCSDGLWEMVRSEGIADVMMQEANPQAACDLLVRLANAAGGDDNISVIVVQVEAA